MDHVPVTILVVTSSEACACNAREGQSGQKWSVERDGDGDLDESGPAG